MELSDDVKKEVLSVLQDIVNSKGKVKVGVNEVTKALQRGLAKLVIVAKDVNPPELVAHLPKIADERKILLLYVDSKDSLGMAAGKKVAASSVAILEAGEAKTKFEQLLAKLPKVE